MKKEHIILIDKLSSIIKNKELIIKDPSLYFYFSDSLFAASTITGTVYLPIGFCLEQLWYGTHQDEWRILCPKCGKDACGLSIVGGLSSGSLSAACPECGNKFSNKVRSAVSTSAVLRDELRKIYEEKGFDKNTRLTSDKPEGLREKLGGAALSDFDKFK